MNIQEVQQKITSWKSALQGGDLEAAMDLHDQVTDHIIKNQNGREIFAGIEMDPKPFIDWKEAKEKIREEMKKPRAERENEFGLAVDQLIELGEGFDNAETVKEVLECAGKAQIALQKIVLNASFLDVEEDDSDEEDGEEYDDPEEDEPEMNGSTYQGSDPESVSEVAEDSPLSAEMKNPLVVDEEIATLKGEENVSSGEQPKPQKKPEKTSSNQTPKTPKKASKSHKKRK